MKREKVESSVLKSVGYDKDKKVLETELVNSTIYEYYQVPFSEYTNLMKSPSLGEYYNTHIKKYGYKKLK
jgi:lysyl-tRNA synthetase class 2